MNDGRIRDRPGEILIRFNCSKTISTLKFLSVSINNNFLFSKRLKQTVNNLDSS